MPKEPKLKSEDWDEFLTLIQEGASKAYICARLGLKPAQFKKAKKKLKI